MINKLESRNKIKELEENIDERMNKISRDRTKLHKMKMELAKHTTSNLTGNCYKYFTEDNDEGRYRYWTYIKLLGLRCKDQMYTEEFSLRIIHYEKPRLSFSFTKNKDTYIQFIKEYKWEEITEKEYKQALNECLKKLGVY